MSAKPLYYDRRGNPIEPGEWPSVKDRRVDFTDLGEVRVSTVHLVVDHGFGNGPPLIFETMVFNGEHDQWQDRYSTEEQAQAGHDAVVAWLRGEGPEPE